MHDNCLFEGVLRIVFRCFRLSLGMAWLKDLFESSKNPLISSQQTRIIYILLAAGFSISFGLLIGFLPFVGFERVLSCDL